jgi:hypothetical protein
MFTNHLKSMILLISSFFIIKKRSPIQLQFQVIPLWRVPYWIAKDPNFNESFVKYGSLFIENPVSKDPFFGFEY